MSKCAARSEGGSGVNFVQVWQNRCVEVSSVEEGSGQIKLGLAWQGFEQRQEVLAVLLEIFPNTVGMTFSLWLWFANYLPLLTLPTHSHTGAVLLKWADSLTRCVHLFRDTC